MSEKFYTGIGSRRTPFEIMGHMTRVAVRLRKNYDFTLRSGGAQGADSAFEIGAAGEAEIYTAKSEIPNWAFDTVEQFHPAPQRCNNFVKRLHARNAMLLFGTEGPQGPEELWSRFIVCWTPNAEVVGGTGQALRIAAHYDIPVFNMARPDILERLVNDQWR